MAEFNQNHTMFAGETKTITVTCRVRSTNALIDFTGATALTWKAVRGSTAHITKTPSGNSSGVLTITLATGDTTSMSGEYAHECRVTLADTSVVTLFSGVLTIYPTITT